MAAVLTFSSLVVAADGITVTGTLSGGTGTGYSGSGSSTPFFLTANNGNDECYQHIGSFSVSGSTVTILLQFPLEAGATILFYSSNSGAITDDGGNTLQGQGPVSVTNNSTKTITRYISTNANMRRLGVFATGGTSGAHNLLNATNALPALAFSATGTDIAVVSIGACTASVDGGSTFQPTNPADGSLQVQSIRHGSDSAHDFLVYPGSFMEAGTGAKSHGTVLVVGSSPALNPPQLSPWGTQYFLDEAPFTTYGRRDTVTSLTDTRGGHTAYYIPGCQGYRFASDSSFVAVFTRAGDQYYSLLQDGVEVGTGYAGTGGGDPRIELARDLDTSTVHEYEVFIYSPRAESVSGPSYYDLYVELDHGGIAAVTHAARPTLGFYGDSRTILAGITDARDGNSYLANHPYGRNSSIIGTGGGQVSTALRDAASTIDPNIDVLVNQGGINDQLNSVDVGTFTADYATMIDNQRAVIGAGKPIICFRPFPAIDGEAAGIAYGAAIQSAIAGKDDCQYVDTAGWHGTTTADLPDGVHENATAYAKIANRQIPIFQGLFSESFSLAGPAFGQVGNASTNFTVTLATGALFTGDQTITIGDGSEGGTFTPSIGSPGVSTVTVTPTNGSSSFTFTYTPATSGHKTLSFTNAQDAWTNPASLDYNSQTGTVTGVSVSPSTATKYGGQTQQFSADVSGLDDFPSTVTWTTTAGSISGSGLLTAPGGLASGAQTVTVRAASTQDPTVYGEATVTVPIHAAGGGSGGVNGSSILGML